MRNLIAPLCALALLAACQQSASDDNKDKIAELTMPHMAALMGPGQVSSMMSTRGEVSLIDVRTPEEFAAGHIAGATNIDFKNADFDKRIAALPKDGKYVLYCRTGHRSGLALEQMQGMGFKNVASMDGGITAWQESKLPVQD